VNKNTLITNGYIKKVGFSTKNAATYYFNYSNTLISILNKGEDVAVDESSGMLVPTSFLM
jgi:hypothetical protein